MTVHFHEEDLPAAGGESGVDMATASITKTWAWRPRAKGSGEGEGEGEGSPCGRVFHTADENKDSVISLSELLRIIQFYNIGAFHCQAGTEDGFAPARRERRLAARRT